jgi:hypothetical protein
VVTVGVKLENLQQCLKYVKENDVLTFSGNEEEDFLYVVSKFSLSPGMILVDSSKSKSTEQCSVFIIRAENEQISVSPNDGNL